MEKPGAGSRMGSHPVGRGGDETDKEKRGAKGRREAADFQRGGAMFRQWIRAAGVRALKSAAQAAISIAGIEAITITGIDWVFIAEVTALAAVLSLLTSIAGLPELKHTANNKERGEQ